MFEKFFEFFVWKKKVVVEDDTPPWEPTPESVKVEEPVPYAADVDEKLKEVFDANPLKTQEPLPDPPPSLDFLNVKPAFTSEDVEPDALTAVAATTFFLSSSLESSFTPKKKDPLVAATAKQLGKVKKKKKMPSFEAKALAKQKAQDDEFSSLLKKLSESDGPAIKKKTVAKKTAKKKQKK